MILLVCAFTLGLGLMVKDQCHAPGGWREASQYRTLCYNDLEPLYHGRSFQNDSFPYVDHGLPAGKDSEWENHVGFVEYPVVTGLFMWSMTKFATVANNLAGTQETGLDFFYWNAAFLAAFALATAFLLLRMTGSPRRVLYFAAATPVVFYSFHNWDLLAVFFTVLTLYWFERGRFAESGIALALGASAKLFPILLAPALALCLLGDRFRSPGTGRAPVVAALRDRRTWHLAAGTIGGLLAFNLPFLLGSRELFLETFRFHMRRTPNFETLWYMAGHYGEQWHLDWMRDLSTRAWLDEAGLALFACVYGGILLLCALGRFGAREGAFGAVLTFLILNKIFSVQYALWVLPFAALLHPPVWAFAFFAAADAFVYVTVFRLLYFLSAYDRSRNGAAWQRYLDEHAPLAWAVVLRTSSLLMLLILLAAGRMRAPREPETPPPAPDYESLLPERAGPDRSVVR